VQLNGKPQLHIRHSNDHTEKTVRKSQNSAFNQSISQSIKLLKAAGS